MKQSDAWYFQAGNFSREILGSKTPKVCALYPLKTSGIGYVREKCQAFDACSKTRYFMLINKVGMLRQSPIMKLVGKTQKLCVLWTLELEENCRNKNGRENL